MFFVGHVPFLCNELLFEIKKISSLEVHVRVWVVIG